MALSFYAEHLSFELFCIPSQHFDHGLIDNSNQVDLDQIRMQLFVFLEVFLGASDVNSYYGFFSNLIGLNG